MLPAMLVPFTLPQTNRLMLLTFRANKYFASLNMQAYGGGGSPSSSSFIIRMDEYNQWRSVHSS
uniref:Uncharacterized protein n=1 Tax=Solanum tuberosum TaxID=4113 RepID=M1AQ34_SOLTU